MYKLQFVIFLFFKDHANIVDVLADNGADVNEEVRGINMLLMAAIKGTVHNKGVSLK